MRIIGIVGQPSSGKDTAAAYLASKGYRIVSTADKIREKMREQDLPLDRPSMHDFSVRERKLHGAAWPMQLICDDVADDTVIAGFRNTAEVDYTRQHFPDNFTLVALSVPLETRYERAKLRNRTGDNISLEDFRKQEEVERGGDSHFHEVDKVIAMADRIIENDGTPEELYSKIDAFLTEL